MNVLRFSKYSLINIVIPTQLNEQKPISYSTLVLTELTSNLYLHILSKINNEFDVIIKLIQNPLQNTEILIRGTKYVRSNKNS